MYHMIACACIRGLTERSLILSRRYLLDILMEPLLKLTSEETSTGLSEDELEACVRRLHFLFVVGNDPSLVFVGHLRCVMLVLLQMHCSITFGVSHLKSPIEQLISAYLRKSCRSLSLTTMRAFAFGQAVPEDKLVPIAEKFAFVPGEGGGVKVIFHCENSANEDSESQPSFYVADDEKSIAVVDLLQDPKDKSLSVDFFLTLLKDLTDLMSEESNQSQPTDFSNKLSESTEEMSSSEAACAKILALERELDETMFKLRKQLMVIRLLGLMSEDDKLQEALSKNAEKMIEFLSITLRRGAILCTGRVERKQEKLQSKSCQNL